MLGSLQTHVLPRFPAVGALIDAIAVSDAALTVVLAGAHPHHIRVLRIHHDATDGERTLVVEHWNPGRAGVGGFPHATGRDRDEVMAPVFRMNREARNAARRDRRTNKTRLQRACWQLFLVLLLHLGVGGLSRCYG